MFEQRNCLFLYSSLFLYYTLCLLFIQLSAKHIFHLQILKTALYPRPSLSNIIFLSVILYMSITRALFSSLLSSKLFAFLYKIHKRKWITLIERWRTGTAKDTSIRVRKHPQHRHTHMQIHPQSDTEQGCQLLQKHHWDNSDNKHSSFSQIFFSRGTLQWKFRANVPLYEHNNTSKSQLGVCAALESKRPNYRGSPKFFAHEKCNDESKGEERK